MWSFMSCRVMRLIVLFDLPMITSKDLQVYRTFRKFLIKNGFIMMQKSVYSRLVFSDSSVALLKKQIEKNLPSVGLIQLMRVTEKQFADIEYLRGQSKTNIINNTKRVIEL